MTAANSLRIVLDERCKYRGDKRMHRSDGAPLAVPVRTPPMRDVMPARISDALRASPSEGDWVRIASALRLRGRALQIAKLIVMDDTKESAIASQLEISKHTVHTDLQRLYRRLGIRSRLQLAQLCERCRE